MKERPILFKAPMVRAILENRKTQTRRVIKPQPQRYGDLTNCAPEQANLLWNQIGGTNIDNWPNPYGDPGDRLWVRETWAPVEPEFGKKPTCELKGVRLIYRADDFFMPRWNHWRPSIYMPRWASRITLEITDVRVERLNDISEDDAKAEGVTISRHDANMEPITIKNRVFGPHFISYYALWEQIHGFGSWLKNPWVWVITFRRLQ